MKYYIVDFMKTNNIFFLGDYSNSEQIEYLMNFKDESFEFNGEVKSLGVELLMPSKSRVANVNLLSHTTEEVMSLQNQGLPKPKLIALLQFTLWSDGRPEIELLGAY